MADWLRQFIDTMVQLAGAQPALTGLLLMLFAAAEAIIVVGALVPGEAMVLALAAAAGAAGVSPWHMLFWVALGAIIGDGISFWIGRRYDNAVAGWPLVRSHPELLDKAKDFIHRQGMKAVVIGRFLPGLRAIMPVAAGILGMPPGRFYVANVLSAIAWAAVHVFPAAALGQAYNQLGAVSGRLTVLLVLLLVVLFLLAWLVRAILTWGAPRLAMTLARLSAWLGRRPDALSQRLARLLDPERGNITGMLASAGVLVAAIAGLQALVRQLPAGNPLSRADIALHQFIQSLRSEPMDRLMVAITTLGDGAVLLPAAAAMILILLAQRAWRLALATSATIGTAYLLVPSIKLLLQKARPMALYEGVSAYSFPSGHTTMTTVIFGVMALLAARPFPLGTRIAIYALYALWAGLVGFSRIYLGAHWPSDVLAGFLIGLALVAAFALWLDIAGGHPRRMRGLAAPLAALAAFIIIGPLHLHASFQHNLARYAPRQQERTISLAVWLHDGWRTFPRHRIDLKGELEEPILLQWADTPTHVKEVLGHLGWQAHPVPSWRDALVFLLPGAALASLPPLPLLHQGRFPALMFSRLLPDGEQRLVLRFWRTDVHVRAERQGWPLHVGSLTREQRRSLGPLGSALREQPVDRLPQELVQALRQERTLRTILPPGGPLLVHPVRPQAREE